MVDENITKEELVIAAWLHDVGKFAQRADIQELYDSKLEGSYCRTTKTDVLLISTLFIRKDF